MEHFILEATLFFGSFIVLTIILFILSKRFTSVPYTVALLVAGYYAQQGLKLFHIPLHIELDAAVIYHILLPILLFESAFNINIHQFKIQFKTISFLATVGLLISVFVIAFSLSWAIGLPIQVALLFGAIISATDPIAVIALFKNLGGPKRLGLLADGESMFNDATGVIAFKLVSTFVIANEVFNTDKLFSSLGDFSYVFIGSMILGAVVGYIIAILFFKKFRNDRLLLTMITIAFSLLVFNAAEYFFHLSGVITVVAAAIVLGNFGKPRVTGETIHFMAEFWENIGFFCISLVFFFATFNLDVEIFYEVPLWHIFAAIGAVLLGRAASIYIGCLITNHSPGFKDEPNVPMSWQHILNWGGLRGVIPLVLVYSIPTDYAYYTEILAFTFGSLLFTLIVNGLTIKYLLLWLKLHLSKAEENIISQETKIFNLEESRKALKHIPTNDFMNEALDEVEKELGDEERASRKNFKEFAGDNKLLMQSFRIQALQIERDVATELHEQGYINEDAYMDFESELDLQLDALEYPDIFVTRGVSKDGHVKSRTSFRKVIQRLNHAARYLPFLKNVIKRTQKDVILNRYMLLMTRILTSDDVIWYVNYVKQFVRGNKDVLKGLDEIEKEHMSLFEDNNAQIKDLMKEHSDLIKKHQKHVIANLLESRESHTH